MMCVDRVCFLFCGVLPVSTQCGKKHGPGHLLPGSVICPHQGEVVKIWHGLSMPYSEGATSQWQQRARVLLLRPPQAPMQPGWPRFIPRVRSRCTAGPPPSPPLVPAAAFPGQPQAVIMTSGPLKREGMLASTVSQSSVVLTPAALTRVSGWDRPSTSYDLRWPSPGLAVLRGSLPPLCPIRLLESQSSPAASW